ncbi:MAG TPA: ATP-binding protein [Steroidobacteraceae bacterium]
MQNCVADEFVAPDPAASLFGLLCAGGGEMGDRIRRYDWSKTSLGPIERWSQAFKTALRLCMASRLPAGIYWGPEHVFLYNDAHCANLGHKHPHALGQPAAIVWPEVFGTIEPLMQKCLLEGKTGGADELPLLLSRPGFMQEVYFSFSYEPLINEQGRIEAVYAIIVDASKRVIAERRLRTLQTLGSSDRHPKCPAEALTAAVRVIERNAYDLPFASFYLWNAGRDEASLYAVSNIEAGSPASPATIRTADDSQLAELARLAGGGLLEVRSCATPIKLERRVGWNSPPTRLAVLPIPAGVTGAPSGFCIVGLNPHAPYDSKYLDFLQMLAGHLGDSLAAAHVYQREEARAKALVALDEAQTTFFGNVSHELRTPLTLMLGPLEEVLDGGHGSLTDGQLASLGMIRRNGMQLLKLVNEVLHFARDQSERLHEMFEPVNLASLTAQVAASFEWIARRAGITFTIECEELDQPVYVDRDVWSRIVLNLLSNAFKYTAAGEISVRLRKHDGVQLIVSDSGVGIPQRELERIFQRFHRVAAAGIGTREGSGIGLALVKEFAEQLGGSVAVHSKLGEGSTFIVSIPFGFARAGTAGSVFADVVQPLPAPEASVQPVALPGHADKKQGPLHHRRVMLVDDNADMREYAARIMSQHFELDTRADGQSALEEIRRRPPDLVITDVMMTGMDGLELLRQLRREPATRAIPVILLSARAAEDARIQGLQHGADDYLVKPVSSRELLARATSAMDLAESRSQVAQQDERVRIARDLHDTLLQSVQGMSFLIEAGLQKLRPEDEAARRYFQDAMQAAMTAVVEGRAVLSLLRAPKSERCDLRDGLLRLGRELLGKKSTRFSVDVVGQQRELKPRAWAEAYAICREALSNAARHAGARSSVLKLSYREDLEIVVSDDGSGMSPHMIARGRRGHFGLNGMRERAAGLGARLSLESQRGAGTTVILTIPGDVAYA